MACSSLGPEHLPGRNPSQRHRQRAGDVDCDGACRPDPLALLQPGYDFGGERRKSGQSAAKAGDDEEAPFWRKIWRLSKVRNRKANDVTANEIRSQSARRHGREETVELYAELPTKERATGCAGGNG